MTRPLLVIFLTIFVNLIGFGIIIPLLPFYAETFGASPIVIGLLFAVFSVCQLIAAPILGDWSDRYGRRPILIFSLLGTVVSFVLLALAQSIAMLFVARMVDGLSGGNISTARAYVADVTEPKDRARAYGLIGMAFGLGFIFGPALSGVAGESQLHRADLGGRGPDARGDRGGVVLAAGDRASRAGGDRHAVPESAGDAAAPGARPHARHRFRVLVRVRDLPDDVRAVHRPAVSVRRLADRLFLRAFGVLGAVVQGGLIRPVVRRLGDKPTFIVGLVCSAVGLVAATLTHSVAVFAVTLVPLALGIGFGHPTVSSLVSRAARDDEQGRVQGAASAVESLGRTVGPVWGNASLQRFGEGTPYLSAAALLMLTLWLCAGYHVARSDAPPATSISTKGESPIRIKKAKVKSHVSGRARSERCASPLRRSSRQSAGRWRRPGKIWPAATSAALVKSVSS